LKEYLIQNKLNIIQDTNVLESRNESSGKLNKLLSQYDAAITLLYSHLLDL